VREIAENRAFAGGIVGAVAYLLTRRSGIPADRRRGMSGMERLRRHWMAIPLGVAAPFMLAVFVVGDAVGWDEGVIGGLYFLVFAIAVCVGSFAAPIDWD